MSPLETSVLFGMEPASQPAQGYTLYSLESASLESLGQKPSVCAIGAFDGVHMGHRTLIEAAIKDAHEQNAFSLAVTFNPDPACVLAPDTHPGALLDVADRIKALLALGLDGVICIDFTTEFSAHTYEQFVSDFLSAELACTSIHVGQNFRMGSGGRGNVTALGAYAQTLGMSLHAHELQEKFGTPVSATRIRSLVRANRVDVAASLLGRPHMVRGVVEHGRGQGTAFGFPTANIHTEAGACLPAEGVYAGWVGTSGHMWPAAINVGAPRTFGGKVGTPLFEATLVGFEGDLYDQNLITCFHSWLRAPQHFPTLEKLEAVVLGNIDWVRQNLGEGEIHD